MVKKFSLVYGSLLLLFCSLSSFSQPLRDINYEYLYDPDAQVTFELKPVRGTDSYTVIYEFRVKDTVDLMQKYTIEWEGRTLLSDREGTPLVFNDASSTRTRFGLSGYGSVSRGEAPRYAVARVIHNGLKRAWLFYTSLEPEFPVNDFLINNGAVVTGSFIRTDQQVRLGSGSGEWIVSHYNDNFPPGAPAFSEAQARVSPVIATDSVYRISGEQVLSFPVRGLYLLQKDTTSLRGVSFRSEDDYPQYSKLANLAGPFIYITTRQEFARLTGAEGNKKVFDRVILGIAQDTDRARILMRNYFRRVELANRYFTSYKEGWKTDRGMIYIVFGKPDEIFRFNDREVWGYDNSQFKVKFNFARSSSLFDPDNYVLLRDKKFEDLWYQVVDLWRNARF